MSDLLHDDAAVIALRALVIVALLFVTVAWCAYLVTRKPRNRRITRLPPSHGFRDDAGKVETKLRHH